MTTEELLSRLPSHIGRNRIRNERGETIAYASDDKEGGDIGWLYLHNEGNCWRASYGEEGQYVCMNPDAENPPYDNAVAYGDTPNEALQAMYDWCVEHEFATAETDGGRELSKLRAQLPTMQEIQAEYGTNRSVCNVIQNIESKIKFHEQRGES